jgi:predicted nucleotidyltransferase
MTRENEILKWISDGLELFSAELEGYRIVLFGSRASRLHRERSDFDLGIYGDAPVPLHTFYKISDFLDRIPTLYRIDWVDLNRAAAAVQKNALANAKVIYG